MRGWPTSGDTPLVAGHHKMGSMLRHWQNYSINLHFLIDEGNAAEIADVI
jgi:hypothetical protein